MITFVYLVLLTLYLFFEKQIVMQASKRERFQFVRLGICPFLMVQRSQAIIKDN